MHFLKKYDDDPDYRGIPAAEARVGRLLVMVIMVATTVFPTLSHITYYYFSITYYYFSINFHQIAVT